MPRLSKIGAAALAAFGWTGLQTVTADFLVVAGGGGGGSANGGGGGAGGYRTGTTTLNPTLSYTVTVGAGGAGGIGGSIDGVKGSDSIFSTITSTGGGFSTNGSSGGSGGSGGGAGYYGTGGAGNTPSTSPSQGNNGGTGFNSSGNYFAGGGGGGASAVGSNAFLSGVTTYCGNGGNGTASSISGTSVTYAGGGGASGYSLSSSVVFGTGGSGGGGNGNAGTGSNGTSNLGGGGGAGGYPSYNGGSGGSGVVIISYVGAQQFGGGVVTSVGGNTIHTFTTSGTLSPLSSLTASALVVAGGGGGGAAYGGGGGAGGYRTGSNLILDTNSIYAVIVGAGGVGAIDSPSTAATNGGDSVLLNITSTGGGYGGNRANNQGANGGSGGGGNGGYASANGLGNTPSTSPSQGNDGGTAVSQTNYHGGGGGGASAAGGAGTTVCGAGGAGTANSISGSSVTYAGGGGGGGDSNGGAGGAGGGGAGTGTDGNGTNGTANTGGGGGGGGSNDVGGNGGSGIVIISYPGSTPQMAGGTVTVAGGNVIHTFTSSGYLSPIVNLNNSLRFRSSASAYLNRTMTTATNNLKWTWSAWVKRGTLADTNIVFGAGDGTSNNFGAMQFTTGDVIQYSQINSGSYVVRVSTNAVFRDPSSWYHVVLVYDSPNATSTDRVQIYVNGTRQSVTYATGPFAQNTSSSINSALAHYISKLDYASLYFDGYMAEINFVDGQALTPNSFGAFNGQGVWQPVRYGGSYGTNGFYLPFNAGTKTYAGVFNGSNQYLTVPDSSVWAFTGNWTIEGFFYVTNTTNALQAIVAQWVDGGGSDRAFAIGVDSSARLTSYVQYGGNQYNPISSSGTIKLNQWYHVALVVNGTTLTLYLNGVAISSTTVSGSINNSSAPVGIGAYGNNNWQISGGISNVRITNTAVYTSNFTVPTANLTAISGTQLLTCQNATFVDNSTNAFTITNNNGTTIAQNYPFSANVIFNDQGPSGNNWTPNNISGASGSTLDYMTDVPTNTSATVANYAVLNPLDKTSSVTLSAANLNYSCSSGSQCRATMGTPISGLIYFEHTITSSIGLYTPIVVGGCTNTKAVTDLNNEALAFTFYTDSSAWFVIRRVSGTATNISVSGTSYPDNGDVLQIAYDSTNGKVWMGKNNNWIDSSGGITGNPSSGTNPTFTFTAGQSLFPAIFDVGASYSGVLNCGQRPFAYTPPTGFLALNTYNLPTPTIGATASSQANKYMDVSLYTGAGAVQSVTNSGSFQPDLVWLKSRSNAYSHYLYDAVRGVTKSISSDSTGAEQTIAQTLTSFDSSGFTLGNIGGAINQSGATFVAWQWRASNTTAVTNTAGSIISTVSANTTAGFSIVTWTGNGVNNSTVGHGLGVTPAMIIVKSRTQTYNWDIYHQSLGITATLTFTTNATRNVNAFGTNNPTASVFSVYTNYTNDSSQNYVAYCFAQVAGYSAFGSYTGNGSTDGPFIYTGFRPRFILYKNSNDASTGWAMLDSSRDTYNVLNDRLFADSSSAEDTSVSPMDFTSNGFKVRSTNDGVNKSGNTIIYMAFAESPFKYANAR